MTSQQFSVCLFCGSRPGNNPSFAAAARALGQELAARDFRLVYGAGDRGLMGEAARAAQAAGGHVTGFIPRHLVEWEVGKTDLDQYVITETMHERKKLMFENSNAVVTLPGGPGTLDELIEVLTWRQLALHTKPIIVVNVEGYWDPLLDLLHNVIAQGFADEQILDYLRIVRDAREGVALIDASR